jgi:hypothetical protein
MCDLQVEGGIPSPPPVAARGFAPLRADKPSINRKWHLSKNFIESPFIKSPIWTIHRSSFDIRQCRTLRPQDERRTKPKSSAGDCVSALSAPAPRRITLVLHSAIIVGTRGAGGSIQAKGWKIIDSEESYRHNPLHAPATFSYSLPRQNLSN